MRLQARELAPIITIGVLSVGILLLLGGFFEEDKEAAQLVSRLGLNYSVVGLTTSITVLMARKNIKILDYTALVALVTIGILFLLVNLLLGTTQDERYMQFLDSLCVSTVYGLFINTKWLKSFCLRFIPGQLILVGVVINNVLHGD